jgi:3-oxosteroid 1-dehydrogenase
MSSFDEVADFVVVGSGGGALCAALYMASKGKQVVVLEKSEYVGGTTARSGGVMWIPDNLFLKRDGISDSFEQAARYLDGLAEGFEDTPGSTPERRHAYLREAPRMVEFLLSQGIKLDRARYWPDYYDERPGGLEQGRCVVADPFNINELGEWKNRMRPGFLEMPAKLEEILILPYFKRSWASRRVLVKVMGRVILALLTGKRYVSAGKALQGRVLQAVLRAGADVRTEAPVSELIVEGGRVSGVRTEKNGQARRIGARLGVLVAAGGFAHNQRMREQYQPGTSTKWSSALPTDTGEMIEEMVRCSAAIGQMNEMVGNQCILVPESQEGEIQHGAQGVTAKPHAILVDQSGVRYMNEGGSYMEYCQRILERDKTVAAVPSWAIFDSQYLKKYMLAGTMPGTKKPDSWYEQGYLKKADSIAELAGMIAVDPETLTATIERFNGFVDKNCDEDFHRGARAYDRWLGDSLNTPSPSLGKINRGPYYAIGVYPGDVGTYGGVVTDAQARVLREDGSVIEGLYATGTSTASVMGRVYPGAGSSVGPTYAWGYVAARHAAEDGDK